MQKHRLIRIPCERSGMVLTEGKHLHYGDSEMWEYNPPVFVPQALHIIDPSADLEVGDWCLFYNSLSQVLEINGTSCKIKSYTQIDEDDVEFLNSMREKKGRPLCKAGDWTTMTHGFSTKQLNKIIASSDPRCTDRYEPWKKGHTLEGTKMVERDMRFPNKHRLPEIWPEFMKTYVKHDGDIDEVYVQYWDKPNCSMEGETENKACENCRDEDGGCTSTPNVMKVDGDNYIHCFINTHF